MTIQSSSSARGCKAVEVTGPCGGFSTILVAVCKGGFAISAAVCSGCSTIPATVCSDCFAIPSTVCSGCFATQVARGGCTALGSGCKVLAVMVLCGCNELGLAAQCQDPSAPLSAKIGIAWQCALEFKFTVTSISLVESIHALVLKRGNACIELIGNPICVLDVDLGREACVK
ncbi:unnamed protein product [Prunus armeniaca]